MSKVQSVIIATSPHRPTDFNAAAVTKVLDESYLIADVKEDGVRLNLCVDGNGGCGSWGKTHWL